MCIRDSIIGENPGDRTKEIYLAELRFLRAHFYQIQVEVWGRYGHFQEKVYNEFDEDMLNINQKSVEFFYTQILEDIDFAIEKDVYKRQPQKLPLKAFLN